MIDNFLFNSLQLKLNNPVYSQFNISLFLFLLHIEIKRVFLKIKL